MYPSLAQSLSEAVRLENASRQVVVCHYGRPDQLKLFYSGKRWKRAIGMPD